MYSWGTVSRPPYTEDHRLIKVISMGSDDFLRCVASLMLAKTSKILISNARGKLSKSKVTDTNSFVVCLPELNTSSPTPCTL